MARIDMLLFPDGKGKALTFSYDDGTIHDRRLVELMNQYQVKGTFNLNGGIFGRKEVTEIFGGKLDISTVEENEILSLYKGHEIAAHGYLHASLPTLAAGSATYEVLKDRERLESILKKVIRGFAYPFGTYNEKVKNLLKSADIEYARTVKSTYNFDLPEDFLEWHPTCHHNDEQLMTLAEKFCKEEDRFYVPKLFYVWGHSYEFEHDKNWNVIEELLSYVDSYKDKIWFATNLEIMDYINAYRQLKYSADQNIIYNPTNRVVWILIEGKKYCIQPDESIYIQ